MEKDGGISRPFFICLLSSACEENILDGLNIVHENGLFVDKSCPHVDIGGQAGIRGNKWDNGWICCPLGVCG